MLCHSKYQPASKIRLLGRLKLAGACALAYLFFCRGWSTTAKISRRLCHRLKLASVLWLLLK